MPSINISKPPISRGKVANFLLDLLHSECLLNVELIYVKDCLECDR